MGDVWFLKLFILHWFISIIDQRLDCHGFCELELYDFTWFYNDSGAIGRGDKQFEANPDTYVNSQFLFSRAILEVPRGTAIEKMITHDGPR